MQQIPSSLEFSNISNINNNETSSINEEEDKKIQSICNEIEDKTKENQSICKKIEDKARESQSICNEIHDNTNATQNLYCCCCNNTANEETIFISPWQPKFKIENVRIFRGNKYSEVKFNFEYVDDGKNMSIDINMFFEKNSDVLCFINGDKMIAGKEETNNIIKDIGRKMNDLLDIIDQYKNNSEITSLAVQCLFIVLFNNRDLYCLNDPYNHQCDVIQGALLQNYEQKLEEFEENMRKKIDEEEEEKKQDEIQEYNDDCRCWKYSKNHITENEIIIQHQTNTNECNNNPVTKNIGVYNCANGNNITVGNGSLRNSVFE